MEIYEVLVARYGDKLWELHEFEYHGLVWKDESPKPTKKELEDQYSEVIYEKQCLIVKQKRQEAYSKISDLKFFEYQRGECTKEEWLLEVEKIKKLYPYPSSV